MSGRVGDAGERTCLKLKSANVMVQGRMARTLHDSSSCTCRCDIEVKCRQDKEPVEARQWLPAGVGSEQSERYPSRDGLASATRSADEQKELAVQMYESLHVGGALDGGSGRDEQACAEVGAAA